MSNPKYTKNAKRKWKTLKKLIERFRIVNGREMTDADLRKALNGGR